MTAQPTPEVIAKYIKLGLQIGMATTDQPIDETLIRQLTDSHRTAFKVAPATNFIVMPSPFAVTAKYNTCTASNAFYGQHDIYWLITDQFNKVELGEKSTLNSQYLFELCKHVGWMWMSSDTTIVTPRPRYLRTLTKPTVNGETLQVLHSYQNLAIEYPDGTGVYAINGTRIPKEYHYLMPLAPDQVPVKDVLGIKNTEIRTEFLKKIGIERAFDSLNKKELETKTFKVGGTYTLFQIELGNITRTYLRGVCPSNHEPFFEAVSPECTTVDMALNFRDVFKLDLPFQSPKILT